ncbi:MAG: DUF4139 domain-containing protein [Bacteroidota bacterium]|nr:DUF4139 domain-containing protein [Bacteroidota bacterium]
MKNLFSIQLFIAINLCSSIIFASKNEMASISNIKNVIVFNKGVNVQRYGSVTLKEGDNTIYIQELSPYLANESIQFLMKSNKVIINSVSKEMNYLGIPNHLSNDVKLLNDSLLKTKENLRLANVAMEVYNQEKDLLNENKSVLKLSKEFIIDDLMDLTDFFRERMLDVEGKISNTNKEIAKINKTIQNIERQINALNSKAKNQYSNVVIQVTSEVNKNIDYELSYNINNRAGWKPCYDIRVDKIHDSVNITYKAEMYQNTNEEWEDIKISLSTGNLNQSNNAPSFNPNYLYANNYYKSRVISSPSPRYDKYEGTAATANVDVGMAMEDDIMKVSSSSADFTTVDFSGTQIQYDIGLPYSITSSNKSLFIEIQKINLFATYDYYSYPKMDKDVFLMCHLSSIAQQNFLSGEAQLFFEGKSVGKTYLDPLSTKKTIDLSLSRDLSIIAQRKPIKKLSIETKIGDKVKQERTFEVSLKNNKQERITVKLVDQIPVSNDKSINVELMDSSEAKLTKNNGKLTWIIELEPNTSVTKSFSYVIKYPEDKRVYGL